MASMEIGIRLPDVGRRTAEIREYAKALREVGEAQQEVTPTGGGGRGMVGPTRAQITGNERLYEQQFGINSAGIRARRYARMGVRATSSAETEWAAFEREVMGRATRLDALGSGGGGGGTGAAAGGATGGALNIFGRRQRLIGPGGFNGSALIARAGMMLEKVDPAAALAVAGMVAFAAGIAEATKRVNELGAASTESGGSMREVGQLAAIGVSPGEISGRAAALRSRLSTDPFAMMASAGPGPQLPPQFGSQNFARIYLDALDSLRKITNEEEQLRQARWLGVEVDLAMIKTSDGVWKATREIGDLQGEIADPATVQATRDLAQSWSNVKTATGGLLEEIAKPVIPIAAEAMKDLAGAIASTTSAIAPLFNTLGDAASMLVDLSEGRFGAIWDKLTGADGESGATQENTGALRDLTYMLKAGVYGGGGRSRSAMPSALAGPMLRDSFRGEGIRLGAF